MPAQANAEVSEAKARLLASNLKIRFGEIFKDASARPSLAFCAVQNGRELSNLCSPRAGSDFSVSTPLPIGKNSWPLLTLMAACMENSGALKLERKAESISSILRFQNAAMSPPLKDLLAMRAGISAGADAIFPADGTPQDVFDIIYQSAPFAKSARIYEYSKLSLSVAGYLCACAQNRSSISIDFLEEFKRCMREYVFVKLGMENALFLDDPAFRRIAKDSKNGFRAALIPSDGIALSIEDASKWLMLETSGGLTPEGVRIADAITLSERYAPAGKNVSDKRALGFTQERVGKGRVAISTSSGYGATSMVAVFPEAKFAIFIMLDDEGADARRLCKETLEDCAQMLESSVR